MQNFLIPNKQEEEVNFASTVNFEVVESQSRLLEVVDILLQNRILGVDTENSGLDPHLGIPILLQIGTSEKCYIFPAYIGLDFSPLKRVLENNNILKVFFNGVYDYKWIFVKYGISIENLFCCQVAERLLTVGKPNSTKWPSLSAALEKYLGLHVEKKTRNNFIDRDPIAKPITKEEFAYSAGDVVALPELFFQQSMFIAHEEISGAVSLENEVLPVFAEMEIHGSLIDRDKWTGLLKEAASRRSRLSQKLQDLFKPVIAQTNLFGLPGFNLDSTRQLLENLHKIIALYKLKNDNGSDIVLESTDEDSLSEHKHKHEIFSLLLDYRGYQKIVSSYGEELLSKIHPITGRLHPSFNQLAADSGRASSSGPNVQQILGFNEDDPESLNFRSCFIARDGYVLIIADYSQQELRILADLSGDPVLGKVYTTLDENGKEIDVHSYTASVVFDIPYHKVGKKSKERRVAKTLNFLLVYGGGAQSLAESIGISVEEAEKIIADYFKRYPKIKAALDRWANEALNKGYCQTVSGRKRWMPLPPQDHPDFKKMKNAIRRKAMNNAEQGSGADVTKRGMLNIRRAIRSGGYDARILKAIHDEVVVEVRKDQSEELAPIVERELIAGYDYYFKTIPMKVDVGISTCWEK